MLHYADMKSLTNMTQPRNFSNEPAITSARKSHFVIMQLGKEIAQGNWKPGQILPSENEFCQRFQTSRTAVREAIKVLSGKGLVEAKPKIGTRVRPISDWNLLDKDVLKWFMVDSPKFENIRSMFELRLGFEPEAVALAAQRRTNAQAEELKQAFIGMKDSQDSEERVLNDLAFHMVILQASANPLFISLGNVISSALLGLFRMGLNSANTENNPWQERHANVMHAVIDQKPEQGRQAMRDLLMESCSDAASAMIVRQQRAPYAGRT